MTIFSVIAWLIQSLHKKTEITIIFEKGSTLRSYYKRSKITFPANHKNAGMNSVYKQLQICTNSCILKAIGNKNTVVFLPCSVLPIAPSIYRPFCTLKSSEFAFSK